MSLRAVLAELRQRGVLEVAAAYAAIGWVALLKRMGLEGQGEEKGTRDWLARQPGEGATGGRGLQARQREFQWKSMTIWLSVADLAGASVPAA